MVNDMRPIDADATLAGIDTAIALLRMACGKDKLQHKAVDLVQHTRDYVAQMKTIDAVPVVRCKDCLYWQSGENECEKWEYCTFYNIGIGPHSFCSYGERKEADGNG